MKLIKYKIWRINTIRIITLLNITKKKYKKKKINLKKKKKKKKTL